MTKNESKKGKPFLLEALNRTAIKSDNGDMLVRFSISESGNLLLKGWRQNRDIEEEITEEIPEALIVKPGGPGLSAGDFGVVNLSSEPLDFQINVKLLLRVLKGEPDPSIFFDGRAKPIEFYWPHYRFYATHTSGRTRPGRLRRARRTRAQVVE